MTIDAAHLDHARKVADAVLFEGYLLYPYHQSARKNQSRFQFGVLMPPAYGALDPSEPSASQTECLLECDGDAQVLVGVRFLQLLRRKVQEVQPDTPDLREVTELVVEGTRFTSWDEAVEREQQVCAQISELLDGDLGLAMHIPSGTCTEDIRTSSGQLAGKLVRNWQAIDGIIRVRAQRVAGPHGALRLRVRIENHTAPDVTPRTREDGLAHALIAAHALIWVPGGSFLSMTDPPEWAGAEVGACVNIGIWPVLAGPADCRDLVLSSPVILYDHAEVAPESQGDLFDATEIDEILTLRTLALTDAEKRAARATDPRAAELIDRLDGMPPEIFDRLHGAIRYPKSSAAGQPVAAGAKAELTAVAGEGEGEPQQLPWWDPGSDTSVSPFTDQVVIDGVPITHGSRVILRPGARRADAQDLFLIGREATVQAVLHDVDGNVHLAVSPDHDPAAELQASHGRFLYFGTDEVEPLEPERTDKSSREED